MGKCSVLLMYDAPPKPMPLGLTNNTRIKVLVKRQLIQEAEEALAGAEALGDQVFITTFRASLDKLRQTLDLLIPAEFEDLYVEGDDHGGE